MNGFFILLTVALYFALLLAVSGLAGKRHADNDAFSGETDSHPGTSFHLA